VHTFANPARWSNGAHIYKSGSVELRCTHLQIRLGGATVHTFANPAWWSNDAHICKSGSAGQRVTLKRLKPTMEERALNSTTGNNTPLMFFHHREPSVITFNLCSRLPQKYNGAVLLTLDMTADFSFCTPCGGADCHFGA
jgi:hypothetical protein